MSSYFFDQFLISEILIIFFYQKLNFCQKKWFSKDILAKIQTNRKLFKTSWRMDEVRETRSTGCAINMCFYFILMFILICTFINFQYIVYVFEAHYTGWVIKTAKIMKGVIKDRHNALIYFQSNIPKWYQLIQPHPLNHFVHGRK